MIIPSTYHQVILKELHAELSGINTTKVFARSYTWWLGMDADIESMVQKCTVCQSVKNQPGTTAPVAMATRIWQIIHINFAEKGGVNYPIVADSHSKWLEVVPVMFTTSSKTIGFLGEGCLPLMLFWRKLYPTMDLSLQRMNCRHSWR